MNKHEELLEIVNHQTEMASLWSINPTAPEAMLQAALRHLHAVIEDDPAEAEAAKKIYWEAEG